jgi:PmbA protein
MKEIYTGKDKSTTISIAANKIHSIRAKTITSTGLRIYRDGCMGVAGAQGKADLNLLEQKAGEMLKMKIPYPYEPSRNHRENVARAFTTPRDFNLATETEEIIACITNQFPDILLSHQVSMHEVESSLSNENGLDLRYSDSFIGMGMVFKEKTSANIMDGYFGYGGREYDRNLFTGRFIELLKAFKTKAELPAKPVLPVIFTTDGSITNKLNAELNGLQIGTGGSLLAPFIGKQKFHQDMTIWQSHNPDDGLMPFFDMEGTVNPSYRVALIENGNILQGYTDKHIAAKYKLPYTGNAGGSYDSIPKITSAFMQFKPSGRTLKELLNGEQGVFVYVSSGGDYTHSGDYGTPVQLAFLTDGENLLGRLPELNIGSNLFRMFGEDFIGVSSNRIYPHDFSHYLVMNMEVSKLY